MADKMQDAEDRLLESMFQTESILDDGFSARAVRRIRRQMWVRRLALPVAMFVGAAIAVKPASQLLSVGSQLFGSVATDSLLPQSALTAQLPLVIVGGMAIALVMVTFRLFEE
jgi:hypothetical protein